VENDEESYYWNLISGSVLSSKCIFWAPKSKKCLLKEHVDYLLNFESMKNPCSI
jgi:hypothetical protein